MQSKFEKMSQRAKGTLDIDDYVERFQNYQPWLNFFTVVSAILIFLLTHWALSGANEYIAHHDGNPELCLLPQTATWWLCAGVFGFILSFEFTLQVWALFCGHPLVELYNEWITGQPKSYKGGEIYMDMRKFFRWLAVFIAFLTGLFTVLDVPSHASL
jgi:hypothetical protein